MAIGDDAQDRITKSLFNAVRDKVIERGYLPDIRLFEDSVEGDRLYLLAKEAIKLQKGFFIDVFSQSAPRGKENKECPRIVITLSRMLEGQIGAPAGKVWDYDVPSGKFRAGLLPSQSTNMVFSVAILSNKTKQDIVLCSIISYVFGQRNFIELYDEPGKRIFLTNTSYNDLTDPMENIIEKLYFYTVADIWLSEKSSIPGDLLPISEIDITIKDGAEILNNFKVT